MDLTSWFAAMVRQDTPRPIVEQIHRWFSQVVRTEETKKFINNIGNDTFDLGIDKAQADASEGDRQLARIRAGGEDPARVMT